MIVIGITRWTDIARYARQFVRLKAHEFAAARARWGWATPDHPSPHSSQFACTRAGDRDFRHRDAILIELAYVLGLGVQPPRLWGGLLTSAREGASRGGSDLPGAAIFICDGV
jgi:ABC-type dipeptide/oligopeptide/nickel transport system permease subunit